MRLLLIGMDEWTNLQIISALETIDCVVEAVQDSNINLGTLKILKFDLMIFDSTLGATITADLMLEYRADGGEAPIIVTVPSNDIGYGILALENGADDFISKPIITQELIARIRALMRRHHSYKINLLNFGPIKFDVMSRTVWLEETILKLTKREKGVLEVLMNYPGRLVSKELIVSYLYTIDDQISFESIETYIYRLRLKIKHPSVAIKTTWGEGYALELVK